MIAPPTQQRLLNKYEAGTIFSLDYDASQLDSKYVNSGRGSLLPADLLWSDTDLGCVDPCDVYLVNEAVNEAVKQMTDWQRTVVVLHLCGYTHTSIAKARRSWERSSRDAYQRALRYLRDALCFDDRDGDP